MDYAQLLSEYDKLKDSSEARINELEIVLLDVQADLLMRAREDSEGMKVVNLSGSIWHRVKKATKA